VPLLTTAERARLRPTVNTEALERFLAAIPAEVRPGVQHAVVLHFSRDVTMTDIRDFLNAVGSDDAAAAVDRAITTRPAVEPGPVTDEPKPTKNESFSMEPPTSPRLRALWDAIEPPQEGSSG
jgi:hypothetical protein